MSNNIFEDLPAPAKKAAPPKANPSATKSPQGQETTAAGGNAKEGSEKKVRQAVYDIRYRARREEIPLLQAFNQYMSHTSMTGPEKAAVKEKLGESYEMNQLASSNVASAMFKVFVEGVENIDESTNNEYLDQLMEMEDKKYKVRVTDKNSGKSYVRMATREKINSLRANPNISSVEMTQYGSPYEGERKGGEQTAKTKAGKGLDPVGKEDADVDNDGKKNDPNDKYIMKRRAAVGAAIEKRKTVSASYEPEGEIVTEVKSTSKQNKKKITGEGVNNYAGGKGSVVKLFPDDGLDSVDRAGQSGSMSIKAGYEMNGVFINEKAVSQAQQKFMGMVLSAKRTGKAASPEVAKAAGGMSEKEARKFAKTKHEGLPVHKEECGMDEKPKLKKSEGAVEDPRAIPTKMNLVKNKLRSMGLKMSYEPEGEVIDEIRRSEKEGKGSPETGLRYPGRAVQKERGEKGGRHHYSGSVEFGGSASERGKKKNEPGSQHQRLNPPEKKGRQLERGSAAAMQRWHSPRD